MVDRIFWKEIAENRVVSSRETDYVSDVTSIQNNFYSVSLLSFDKTEIIHQQLFPITELDCLVSF